MQASATCWKRYRQLKVDQSWGEGLADSGSGGSMERAAGWGSWQVLGGEFGRYRHRGRGAALFGRDSWQGVEKE